MVFGLIMFPALLLIPLIALFRVFLAWQPAGAYYQTILPGACPLSAVALCAGMFLPRRLALVVPLSILLLSDLAIDVHYHENFFSAYLLGRYVLLALVGLGGLALRGRRGVASVLGATLAGSMFFYVVSNALTWLGSPAYPQTLAGLWQALSVGLPGFPPSYVFFRNGLVSDGLYSMVFVACVYLSRSREERFRSPLPNRAGLDTALADARQQG